MLRDATIEDYNYMAENSVSRGLCGRRPEQIDYVYALEAQGELLGIGGFRLLTPATAFVWIDLTDVGQKHFQIVARNLKREMKRIAEEFGLRRMETYAAPDFPQAVNLLQWMGFEKECVMKNYLTDSDAFLYRRLF